MLFSLSNQSFFVKKLRNPGNRFNAHNQSWNICWPDGLIKLVRSNIAVLWWHAHSIVTGHCSSAPVTIAMRLLGPSLNFNSEESLYLILCRWHGLHFLLRCTFLHANDISINFKGYSLQNYPRRYTIIVKLRFLNFSINASVSSKFNVSVIHLQWKGLMLRWRLFVGENWYIFHISKRNRQQQISDVFVCCWQ